MTVTSLWMSITSSIESLNRSVMGLNFFKSPLTASTSSTLSLSFFQMPLSAFPKTFGLTELKKGYFLHLFNIPENQEYVGSIPEKYYYMPESMSVSGRKNFEKWYGEQVAKNVEFDFQNELVEYCGSDVKLLDWVEV